MKRLPAAILAVAVFGAGASQAAGDGSVTARVVANPLAVALSISPAQAASGASVTASATVTNLGAAPVADTSLELRVDAGVRVGGGAVRTITSIGGNAVAQATWPLCGLQPGNYVVVVEAVSGSFETESAGQLLEITAGSAACPEDAAQSVAPGGTATTDSEGEGATAADPVETSVTTPNAGTVAIGEQPAAGVPGSGLVILGWQVQISAPAATQSSPLRIVFELDASLLGGVDPLTIEVFRNGLAVGACPGDPCLASRALQADGDLELAVLTSAASTWTFGTVWPFAGFFAPVDDPPTLNLVTAGRAVPVKFKLGGDRGLAIFASGYPRSQAITCETGVPVDAVEEVLTAGASTLGYDAATAQYTYVWKTEGAWAGTCRQLVIRLVDGTEHRAGFKLR